MCSCKISRVCSKMKKTCSLGSWERPTRIFTHSEYFHFASIVLELHTYWSDEAREHARMNGEKERLSGSEWVLSFHPVLPSLMTIKKTASSCALMSCIYAIKKRARRHQLNNFYVMNNPRSDRSWLIVESS